jgi:isopenicillin-N epimerase
MARRQFDLSPGTIHMSALLVATHPRPVREAIRRYREELARDPVERLTEQNERRAREVRVAAADYLGCHADDTTTSSASRPTRSWAGWRQQSRPPRVR